MESMRELLSYENGLSKNSTTSADSTAGNGLTGVGGSISQATSCDSMMCHDPFYDRFPWFRLVGRYDAHL